MKQHLKYGDRDVSEGSLVFSRSKDGKAYGEPLPSQIHKPKSLNLPVEVKSQNLKTKEKCSPVIRDR